MSITQAIIITGDLTLKNMRASIFPNPAVDKLWLMLDPNMYQDRVTIKIIDMLGRVVLNSKTGIDNKTEIDVSGISNGIYRLVVLYSEHPESLQFIKN
jgi:hypothetical protein